MGIIRPTRTTERLHYVAVCDPAVDPASLPTGHKSAVVLRSEVQLVNGAQPDVFVMRPLDNRELTLCYGYNTGAHTAGMVAVTIAARACVAVHPSDGQPVTDPTEIHDLVTGGRIPQPVMVALAEEIERLSRGDLATKPFRAESSPKP